MDDDHDDAELSSALEGIGRAELVVGIPSFGSARAIGDVVAAVVGGVAAHIPGIPCVLVNADSGSRDGTPDVARRAAGDRYPVVTAAHAPPPQYRLATSDPGFPGRGDALRTVFRVVERLGARACVLVDADVRAITPGWMPLLAEPVLRGTVELVAPLYAGHRYDGMLTSSLIYPLTRALYGRRVRQPVGGHFGLSGALAGRLLRSGVWDREGAPSLDLWMTTMALADGLRVGQARLGAGRGGTRRGAAGLGASFAHVVGTVFALMEEYRPAWWAVVGTEDVPTFGPAHPVGLEPVSVNVDRMISTFRQGVAELMPVWRRALGARTCAALAALEQDAAPEFRFPATLWAQAVYDAAAAYHRRALARRHLLRAMIPLYLGRIADFVLRTASGDGAQVEAEVESGCRVFESLKPHLLDRWDAPRP